MFHTNYFEIQANSYYDLGLKEGQLFKQSAIELINKKKQHKSWDIKLEKSKRLIGPAEKAFSHLVEELKGYAKGAKVLFSDLWVLSLEDELSKTDRCTTVVTNSGKLIAHNEDWNADSKDAICVLKKSIKDFTILELFYYNTLGGNSISINSHGFVQAVNTLVHSDRQIGIPRNVIARWLSETKSPQQDFNKLSTLQRSAGYSHTFINLQSKIWNIESTASRQILLDVTPPFVHTNHYLTELKKFENNNNLRGSMDRYEFAHSSLRKSMSLTDLQKLMSNNSKKTRTSVFNKGTIARMIVNLEKFIAYIWLLRESKKGWIKYNIDFLNRR